MTIRPLLLGVVSATLAAAVHAQNPAPPAQPPAAVGDPKPGDYVAPKVLAIHEAARQNKIDELKKALAEGASVDTVVVGGSGWIANSTPLFWATRFGTPEVMKFLLDNGANPNHRSSENVTALMLATQGERSAEKVRLLLNAGAEPNAGNWDGDTPLHWAAVFSTEKAVFELLVGAGARLEYKKARDGTSAFTIAARRGNIEAMRALHAAGADIESRSVDGSTPLMWACEGPNATVESIAALLDLGASMTATSADGTTPLMAAALSASADRVHLLLKRGADPLATTPRGDNALMAAARSGSAVAIKALLDAGVKPNDANKDGITPLILAVTSRRGEAVRTLIAGGADVNHVTAEGWSPILLSKDVFTLEPLIEAGANIETRSALRDFRGWTPLMFMTLDGDYFSVRRLINAGADVNARDGSGRTALRIAPARRTGNKQEVIDLLRSLTTDEGAVPAPGPPATTPTSPEKK